MYIGGPCMEIKTEAVGDDITGCPSTAGVFDFTADKFSVVICLLHLLCVVSFRSATGLKILLTK